MKCLNIEYDLVDGVWCAIDDETKIFAFGNTKDESKKNLIDIVKVYYRDIRERKIKYTQR